MIDFNSDFQSFMGGQTSTSSFDDEFNSFMTAKPEKKKAKVINEKVKKTQLEANIDEKPLNFFEKVGSFISGIFGSKEDFKPITLPNGLKLSPTNAPQTSQTDLSLAGAVPNTSIPSLPEMPYGFKIEGPGITEEDIKKQQEEKNKLIDPFNTGVPAVDLAPGTMDLLSKLQVDPLSLKNAPRATLADLFKPFWLNSYGQEVSNSYIKGIKEAIDADVEAIKGVFAGKTASEKTGAGLQATARTVGVVLSPITSLFTAADNLPVLGSVSKLIELPFAILGDLGNDLAYPVANSLPISRKAKENIVSGIGEITGLALMIGVGGKAAQIPAKTKARLIKKYGETDAKTIIKQAEIKANEAPPEKPMAGLKSPDEVIDYVNKNNLAQTEEGKILIKLANQAKQENKYFNVEDTNAPVNVEGIEIKPLGQEVTVYRGTLKGEKEINTNKANGITGGESTSTDIAVAENFAKNKGGEVKSYSIDPKAKIVNHSDLEAMVKDFPTAEKATVVKDFLKKNNVDVVKFDVPKGAKGEAEYRIINPKVLKPIEKVAETKFKEFVPNKEAYKNYAKDNGLDKKGMTDESVDWLDTWLNSDMPGERERIGVPPESVVKTLEKFKPSEPIKVYRGVVDKGGTLADKTGYESWTTSKRIATKWAGKKGKVLEKTVGPDDVLVDWSKLPKDYFDINGNVEKEVTIRANAKDLSTKSGKAVEKPEDYVYHVTKKQNIESIRKQGLVPSGASPLVYFDSDIKSAIKWGKTPGIGAEGGKTLLRVKKESMPDATVENYSKTAAEWLSKKTIKPSDIEVSLDKGKTWKSLIEKPAEKSTTPPSKPGNKGGNKPKTMKEIREDRKFTSRVFQRLQNEYEGLKGDLKVDAITLKEDAQRAVDLIAKDREKAYRIAMNIESSPDVTSTAVNIAMTEKALAEGNNVLVAKLVKNRSLAQTRRGQEIVSEKGSINDNSTSRYLKELISTRLDKMGDKYLSGVESKASKTTPKQRAMKNLEKEVEKAQKKLNNKDMDIKEAQSLIDKLACS
jgi:hypothetical protein